jgi:thiamine-phosphate pyrophosphorylase
MTSRCLFCYITDRRAFSGDETARRRRLLEKIAEAARAGVDYIQLREKDLPRCELESLAREAIQAIRENAPIQEGASKVATKKIVTKRLTSKPLPIGPALLINSRTDVALAVGADGVHLRSDDISATKATEIWNGAGSTLRDFRRVSDENTPAAPLIGVSCHSPAEVAQAAADGATFAVFAPVFEKKAAPGTHPTGLALLQQACRVNIPVLALGGVNLDNVRSCLEAGAAGIAGIRLFQKNDVASVVEKIRGGLAP